MGNLISFFRETQSFWLPKKVTRDRESGCFVNLDSQERVSLHLPPFFSVVASHFFGPFPFP